MTEIHITNQIKKIKMFRYNSSTHYTLYVFQIKQNVNHHQMNKQNL